MFESQDRSGTSRLFIAWDSPESWRTGIEGLVQEFAEVEGVRTIHSDQIHCTVLFIGEVPNSEVAGIEEAFLGIRGHKFLCSPCRSVAFPTSSEPRVLALELVSDPIDRFLELHRDAERSMTGFRVKRDRRKFRPHLTVARCNESAYRQVQSWQIGNLPHFPAEYLSRLTLYRSLMTHQGATYEKIVDHYLT